MVRVIRQVASAFPESLASLTQIVAETNQGIVLFEPTLKIAQPISELLTDFEREYFTVLAIDESGFGDATVAHQRLLSVQTADHQIATSTHQLIPALYIPSAKLPLVRNILKSLAKFTNAQIEPIQYLILALTRNAEEIRVLELDSLPEISLDPAKLRLQLANRSNDGLFSTFVLRKISKIFTRIALKLRLKPNFITTVSFLVGFFAAIAFAQSNYLIGALLLQLSLTLDCVDGEVARYTKQFSRFGAWLDAMSDRVKEFMAIGAIAYSAQNSVKNIWLLASVAVILQTVKHISDYNFTAVREKLEVKILSRSIDEKFDGFTPRSVRKKSGIIYWCKKVIYFPIGERWLLISLGVISFGPKTTLLLLIGMGILSLTYVKLGRIRRSLHWNSKLSDCEFLNQQGDLGVALKFAKARFGWAIPSLLRLLEFILILAIFNFNFNSNLFAIIFTVAIYHYVNLYDSLNQIAARERFLGLYVFGRLSLLFVASQYLENQNLSMLLVSAYLALVIFWRGARRLGVRGN